MAALLVTGCSDDDEFPSTPLGGTFKAGSFLVDVDPLGGKAPAVTIFHAAQPEKVLWESIPGEGFAAAAVAEATVIDDRAHYTIEDRVLNLCDEQTLDRVEEDDGVVILSGELRGDGRTTAYSLRLIAISKNQLGFDLRLVDPSPDFNRVFLRYASSPDERFFGFGEQFTFLDLKGRSFPILSQEQGIFRGKEPFSTLLELFVPGAAGDWYSTYSAVPQYITSRMRSLFLENDEVSFFDLKDPDGAEIKLFGPRMKGRILYGETPLDLIREFTAYTGRMAPLPDWLNEGAVVGMQGGTAAVYEKLEQLEAVDAPIGAFWLQDWVSNRETTFGKQLWWNWELNEARYPGWTQMVRDLEDKGIRVMIYMNPSLVDVEGVEGFTRNFFREAEALGYLVKNRHGETYPIQNSDFDAGFLDLTHPEARIWWKDLIREQMLGIGASGWMADYGEALPFDSVLHSGEDPAAYHNRYPEEWARLNREVLSEEGLEGDAVFFSRAGNARSPGQSSLFWLGDQLVTFDGDDGMKSAIKGMLSGGLSGWSLNHSDIGGFTTISMVIQVHRSKELLLRWMEMSAFTSVYRTHEGVQPDKNVQFYTDSETYEHFARFAKVFRSLAFYRTQLMEQAAEHGFPVMRHPLLHYPEDPDVYGLKYQWLVGSEIMVVPVVDEGDSDVNAYLPGGEWVHVWTGDIYTSEPDGRWHRNVAAPMGQPGVFYKRGSPVGQTFAANLRAEGLISWE
jgi:alpha-glucosidase